VTAGAQGPVAPVGLNYVVINVRDMAESHAFWTEIVGLRHVADFTVERPGRGPMRFYSGVNDGAPHHHDIALVESPALSAGNPVSAIGHIAFALPDRESWLRQLSHLRGKAVAVELVEHGMSHSIYFRDPNGYKIELLYELPREAWEQDIGAALNHYVIHATGEFSSEGALVPRVIHMTG
jgi:catechol 2,3-dioxygenase